MRAGLESAPLHLESFRIEDAFVVLATGGREYRLPYARVGSHIHVAFDGESYEFIPADHDEDATADAGGGFVPELISPMPGKVLKVLVDVGQPVEAGQGLLLLEAMKMEQTIRAAAAATVEELRVAAGDMVGPGQILVVLSERTAD
jgi:3-methylcrotonyl-CoA carboxylase alpha subunit